MRIDAIQVAANAAAGTATKAERPGAKTDSAPSAAPAPLAAAAEVPKARELSVSVSFVENQVIVYRFVDKDTGDLIVQVPPEQMLQVMRSIDEMLNAENSVHQKIDIRW